ncbi:hypothetical protein QYF36_005431 [Acer negundo]|nr:hypothetical protein QYF36_005431 [Acer negundo]
MSDDRNPPTIKAQLAALTSQMNANADRLHELEAKNATIRARDVELQAKVEVAPNNTIPMAPMPMVDNAQNIERTAPLAPGLDFQMHKQQFHVNDFDEDYIGHGGSRGVVNDGIELDPSEGGRSGSLPSIRDTCEDDAINVGDGHWEEKELVEQNIFGPPNLSYQLLPAYCHQLKLVNPGTVIAIKTNAAQQFEYFFIVLSASLVGFQTTIRPAICIAVTHLKGKLGGVMFIVACQDANNQVFPLAYGWGDVECEDSWTWFLKELKKVIGCPANCIIIFDRSPTIKVAMDK